MHKTLIASALFAILGVAHAGSATPPAPEKVARGLMLYSQDRMIFSPCRDRSYTSVEDGSSNGELSATLKQFGLADGKPLYVEVFGEAQAGMLRMHALNMAQQDARCYAPRRSTGEWRAAGGKPAWALTLFEGEATLQRADDKDLTGKYEETRSTPTEAEIRIAGGSTAAIRMTRQNCRETAVDGGKERLYAWTAEIDIGGQKLQGCAWRQ